MARKKVEAVTGCYAKAADDEPLFVLRATDVLAPLVVRTWADMAADRGVSEGKVAEARQLAEDMELWQTENGSKIPD